MASIIDIFNQNKDQYEIKTKSDKTPLSNDGGKNLIADKSLIDAARRGVVPTTLYSDTVNK